MLADLFIFRERRQHADERHGCRRFAFASALKLGLENLKAGYRQCGRFHTALGQIATQRAATFLQIFELFTVGRRLIVRNIREIFVRYRDIEAIAHFPDLFNIQLLLLMRCVLAFTRIAHAKTFYGFCKNDRWLPCVAHRRIVGSMHLKWIVATALQAPDLVIGHIGDHLGGFRLLAEELLAHVSAVLRLDRLVFTVNGLFHDLAQLPRLILGQQRVPIRAPDDFDDVPACSAERRFKLLDNLAIATYRTVKALQVAVDDKNEIVEPFAHRHRDRAHRFRFIHLAIAEERPDLPVRARD